MQTAKWLRRQMRRANARLAAPALPPQNDPAADARAGLETRPLSPLVKRVLDEFIARAAEVQERLQREQTELVQLCAQNDGVSAAEWQIHPGRAIWFRHVAQQQPAEAGTNGDAAAAAAAAPGADAPGGSSAAG